MKIIRASEQTVTHWAGGTTCQLFIYPENSAYADRNFEFRISTATVETETSVFTSLPGYSRQLMVLEGELRLEHEDQHITLLKKFDVDHFRGEWKTVSYGKATDFNVMWSKGYEVSIHAYRTGELSERISEDPSVKMLCLYVYKGNLFVKQGDQQHSCSQGDFIVLEGEECREGMTMVESCVPVEIIAVLIEKI